MTKKQAAFTLSRGETLRRWIGGKVCLLLTIRFLRIYKAFYKGFS